MEPIDPPSKEQVRGWIKHRQTKLSSPSDVEEIRRELGWIGVWLNTVDKFHVHRRHIAEPDLIQRASGKRRLGSRREKARAAVRKAWDGGSDHWMDSGG